jgi:hypothetical protein
MNNQEQESVTNSKASYSSDFNSSNNNSLEDSDETDDYEDNSNSISNPKVYLITIQIYPDEQQAIFSIGIKNAPPIIKNASYQEITQQTIIKFLLSVMGSGYSLEYWEEEFGFKPDYIADVENIDFQKLVKICNKLKSPIKYLVNSLSLLDYSTGNIWLDTTYETGYWWEWSEENVLLIADKWQEASTLLNQFKELSDWIEISIANRDKVVKVWNQAAI